MNKYAITDNALNVIQIESDDLSVENGAAIFRRWVRTKFGGDTMEVIAVYPMSGIQSITLQRSFTEEEITNQVSQDE